MERGRRCGGSQAAGALSASRNSPSSGFALNEPSKEAHDSEVRKRSADAGGVAQGQAARSPAPRAHRSVRPRGPPLPSLTRIASSAAPRRPPAEKPVRLRLISGRFWSCGLGEDAAGPSLMWVAPDGASPEGRLRAAPRAGCALESESQESVCEFAVREAVRSTRFRRDGSKCDAPAVARGQAPRSPTGRAHISVRPRGPPLPSLPRIASLPANHRVARDDDLGFLSPVTDLGPWTDSR